MDLLEWYRNTVGEDSENQVARQAGIVQRTLNRQLAKGELAPESVAAIARAYRKDVLDALVIAGLITPKDIRDHGVKAALDEASDKEISEIVARRLSRGEHPEFEG